MNKISLSLSLSLSLPPFSFLLGLFLTFFSFVPLDILLVNISCIFTTSLLDAGRSSNETKDSALETTSS